MKIPHISIAALAGTALLLSSCVVTPADGYGSFTYSTNGYSAGVSVGWTSASYDANGFPIYGYSYGRPVYGYTAAGAAIFSIAALTALCFVPDWGPAPWYCGHWHYPPHIHRVSCPPRYSHGHHPGHRPSGGAHGHHSPPHHGGAHKPSHHVQGPHGHIKAPQPNVGTHKPGVGGQRPNMGSSRPNMGGSRPNMGGSRPSMGSPRPNMGSPRPNMGGSRPSMGGPRPSMNRVHGASRPAGFSRGGGGGRHHGRRR